MVFWGDKRSAVCSHALWLYCWGFPPVQWQAPGSKLKCENLIFLGKNTATFPPSRVMGSWYQAKVTCVVGLVRWILHCQLKPCCFRARLVPTHHGNMRLPTWAKSGAAPAVLLGRWPREQGLVTSSVIPMKITPSQDSPSRKKIMLAWRNMISNNVRGRRLGVWKCLIINLGKLWSFALTYACGGSHSHFQEMFIQTPSTAVRKGIKGYRSHWGISYLELGFNHFKLELQFAPYSKLLLVTQLHFMLPIFCRSSKCNEIYWHI